MRQTSLLIKKPWITEKATDLAGLRKYVFAVDRGASSFQIKQAIESVYGVHVVKINVLNKVKGMKITKKAIVTLRVGEKIDIVPH